MASLRSRLVTATTSTLQRLDNARRAFARAPQPRRPSVDAAGFPNHPGAGRPSSIDWTQDQPLPPRGYAPRAGYDDHLYQQFSAPLAVEGFGLERIRAAVAMHRLGLFYESWALTVAMLGFAPYLAALQSAVAPVLALHSQVKGGQRGLSRLVRSEIEEALIPAAGLMPSPYFPPTLKATSIIYQRTMGFSVLQHVDGDPDPDTGIKPRFTRIWEPWAVQCISSPLKWLAVTTEGLIEIGPDSHFTLVADEMRPHLSGAVVALGEETLAGRLTQDARNAWIDRNGQIKWVATLPPKIATHGDAGDDFFAAVQGIAGPDGLGIFPFGSTFQAVALTRDTSGAFGEALAQIIDHCAMVLTGSPGALTAGSKSQYEAKGGAMSGAIRQDLIDRPTIAFVRAVNQGHVLPYCEGNYGEAIERARRVKAWEQPALDIALDDPEQDARVASITGREAERTKIIDARRASGIIVTQDDSDQLSDQLGLPRVVLAVGTSRTPTFYEWELEKKAIARDEVRAAKGLDPLPDGMGSVEQLAKEISEGKDETGATRIAEEVAPQGGEKPPPAPATTEPAPEEKKEEPTS